MVSEKYKIVVIVPVFNEAERVSGLLDLLQRLSKDCDVIIVDGGSTDDTAALLIEGGYSLIYSDKGRATQMNAGVHAVEADCYWFLHADCDPADDAVLKIQQAIERGYEWGRFDVRLTGTQWAFRVIEAMMNWRSCLAQVATGDQGIFICASLLKKVGGFPDISLMEDIAISKRLRMYGKCACLRSRMQVSSRRWEEQGIIRMTLLMWWLRLRYVLGADPSGLHRDYYGR